MKMHFSVMLTLALLTSIHQSAAQSTYTPYTFTTLAGGFGTNDGTGLAAQFEHPSGVAVDTNGNVYVADYDNNTIRKMTSMGTNWVVTTLAGLAGVQGTNDGTGSAARFNRPTGITVDNAGNLYVADTYNFTIRKIAPVGTNWIVTTLAGTKNTGSGENDGTGSAARFVVPNSVAVDSATNVFVVDYQGCTLRKVTQAGVVTTLAGMDGFAGTNDGTGSAARFFAPAGVAVDGSGNVYVADAYNSAIRKVTPVGTNWVVTTLAGLPQYSQFNGSPIGGSADGTGSAARFNYPSGVAVDTNGNVYVADANNQTIRKVTAAGVVTTLAGLVGIPGSANGTGSTARFNVPYGVAVDNAGNVYVADQNNSTIRKGFPAIAPVIVTDSMAFTSSFFGFNLTGPDGQLVVVEVSTNLINWLPVFTNTFGVGALPFSDAQSGTFSKRFYRARTP